MKKISRFFYFVYAMLLCMPCFAQDKSKHVELSRLRDMLTGDFRSIGEVQVGQQRDFVLLRSRLIWHDRTDGYWLYAEQFALSDKKKPVVQTVLHVYLSGNQKLVCQPYTVINPSQFASGTNQQSILGKISFADIKMDNRCAFDFQKQTSDVFIGKITGSSCNAMAKLNANAGIEWEMAQNEFSLRFQDTNHQNGQTFLPALIAAKYQRELPE